MNSNMLTARIKISMKMALLLLCSIGMFSMCSGQENTHQSGTQNSVTTGVTGSVQSGTLPINQKDFKDIKSIICLIADGCGVSHMTATRWFKNNYLAQEKMNTSMVRTYSGNSIITGSAAAATAFACGYKTWEEDSGLKCIGMLPDKYIVPNTVELSSTDKFKPVASVLEAARLKGKSTGLVSTSRFSHATPAGYSSHWYNRDNEDVISKQQVYQFIDVVFGGGLRYLSATKEAGGVRKDGEDLLKVLTDKGYLLVTTRTELLNLSVQTKKVWGMFNVSHMQHDIDRKYFGHDEPSLSEMTSKALSILSQNQNGFFLMVEGSEIDWASHNNDPVGVVTDYMAFDSTVSYVSQFAKDNPGTVVMVFSDHDNGGMSVGTRFDNYTNIQPDSIVKPLKKACMTAVGVLDTLVKLYKSNPTTFGNEDVSDALKLFYGIDQVTQDESELLTAVVDTVKRCAIQKSHSDAAVAIIAQFMNKRSHIGWTTYGHTGQDVPGFYRGINGKATVIDNTDIARISFAGLHAHVNKVNARLFMKAEADSFGKNVTIQLDTVGVEKGLGTLIITKKITAQKTKSAQVPFFKNIMIINGSSVEMEGIAVYCKQKNCVYLPKQAVKLFRKAEPVFESPDDCVISSIDSEE